MANRNPTWKHAEREFSRLMQGAVGPVKDPRLRPLVTATGRVGHLSALGFDTLVGEGKYGIVGESKRRRKILTVTAMEALLQLVGIAAEWDRTPVLGITFTEDVPLYTKTTTGDKVKVPRVWVMVPIEVFAEVLHTAARSEGQHTAYPGYQTTTTDKLGIGWAPIDEPAAGFDPEDAG